MNVVKLARLEMDFPQNSQDKIEVFIGLGANAGEPRVQISEALEQLKGMALGPVRCSSLWRSEAYGMNDNSSDFVNAVAAFDTGLPPLDLLTQLQAVEVALGRPANHATNVARSIDLDLLVYGGQEIQLLELQVPHPRMLERLFVLLPLQELAPEYKDQIHGLSLEDWIARAPQIAVSRL